MIALAAVSAPVAHFARNRVGVAADIRARAKRRELCPEEHTRAEPAVMLPNQLERLRNFDNGAQKDRLFRSALGAVMRHAPSVAYTLENATLVAGSVYAGGDRLRIRALKECLAPAALEEFDRAALCTGLTGDLYFGHFLTEDIPQMLLADAFGEPFRLPARDWPHLGAYRDALGTSWREAKAARFRALTFFDDYAQNSLRTTRYRRLRARLRRKIAAAAPGSRIYIRRGKTGSARAPVNEAAVETALVARGFSVLDIEATPPRDFIAALLDAKVVASVEGSNMMHAVYTIADTGGGLVLMPPMRPKITNKDRFDGLGLPCAIHVGEDLGERWRVNLDEMEETLDRLELRIEDGHGARARRGLAPA